MKVINIGISSSTTKHQIHSTIHLNHITNSHNHWKQFICNINKGNVMSPVSHFHTHNYKIIEISHSTIIKIS